MTLSRKTLHIARVTVLVLFWPALLGLITGSLIPLAQMPLDLGVRYEDLILHFTGYAGLGGMAATSIHRRSSAIWAAVGLIVLGAVIEVLQSYTGRDTSLFDAIANAIGASFGCFVGRVIVEPFYRRYGFDIDRGEIEN